MSHKIKAFKSAIFISAILTVVAIISFAFEPIKPKKVVEIHPEKVSIADKKASQVAFLKAYKVLMHPRCMNCHPAGDVPLQGEKSTLHTMGVKRGPEGKGVFAMKCTNCHQEKNVPGLHMPPGNSKWLLPPADMKMVFQGKTPKQLATQLKDRTKNGNKSLEELVEHVTHDDLVLAGWRPADGLKKPSVSHAEFAKNFTEWIRKGAAIPD